MGRPLPCPEAPCLTGHTENWLFWKQQRGLGTSPVWSFLHWGLILEKTLGSTSPNSASNQRTSLKADVLTTQLIWGLPHCYGTQLCTATPTLFLGASSGFQTTACSHRWKSCFQPGGKVGKEEEPQTTLSLTTHLIHPMTKDYFRTTSDPLRPWVMLGDTQAAVTSPVIPIVRTQSLKGMAWPPHPQQPLG